MTTKKKRQTSPAGRRMATVALSLCLLAGVTLFGMYTVGKTEEQQRRLEQEVADAEKAAQARQQELADAKAAREQKAAEAERQAASGSASRDRIGESAAETAQVEVSETAATDNAELEGEYAEISVDEPVLIEANAGAEAPPLSFSAETDQLLWPIAGNILVDYSMDKTVYFPTLDQYKYNPAIIIEGSVDQSVLSAAAGKVTSIENLDETGTTITMDIGSGDLRADQRTGRAAGRLRAGRRLDRLCGGAHPLLQQGGCQPVFPGDKRRREHQSERTAPINYLPVLSIAHPSDCSEGIPIVRSKFDSDVISRSFWGRLNFLMAHSRFMASSFVSKIS